MQFLNPPYIIAILIALSVHEWAHGFAAWKLGDPTAKYEGRLTLNPIAHLDPLGTILFLIIGFGWGKPVPIEPRYFKHPKRDMAITALAGPLSNLILAAVSVMLIMFIGGNAISASPLSLLPHGGGIDLQRFFLEILTSSLFVNLGLMAFNLLPVSPLDGSKILLPFISRRYDMQYHQFLDYGPYILFALLIAESALNIPIITLWTMGIMSAALHLLTAFL